MAWPVSLRTGLKEWDVTCRALASGRQIMLLRKGGIHEVKGVFQLEEREFLLYPTYVHQNREMLKAEEQGGLDVRPTEPGEVVISSAAVMTDIAAIERRGQIDVLNDQHIWTTPYMDMRFNYKPQNPLYLILLRVYRLPEAVMVTNTPSIVGCRSWVPMDREISTAGAAAVMDDARYAARRTSILDRVGSA